MSQGQMFKVAIGVVVVAGAVFIGTRMMGGKPISIPANVVVTAADTTGFRGYVIGDANAPIEITEYGDFQCPGCGNFDQVQWPSVVTQLIKPGKARFRFRDYPWDQLHSHTRVASHAAACSDDQGKFWQVKEGLFARQNEWAPKSDVTPIFKEIVKNAGGDVDKWMECMQSKKYAGRIQASLDEGTKLGVNETPSFLVGGRLWTQVNSDMLVHLVDSLIAAQGAPKKP